MVETAVIPPILSVVIPSWNGKALLARFLPSIVAEVERWAQGCEIVIADDGSSDGTAGWLRELYPQIRCVRSESNRGFGPTANAGVEAAQAEIVVLLNNDLELAPGSLDFIPWWFADPRLFGITFRGFDLPERSFATGGKLGRFRRGFWETWRNYESSDGVEPACSFMLVGGFCAFRRRVFLELGGFDPAFSPYYSEDLDLSYRARKRGWRLGYEPRAVVYHAQSSSVKRHGTPFRRAVVIERNRLLFHWRNLDRERLQSHLVWALLRLPQLAVRGHLAGVGGFVAAMRRWPAVARFRRQERLHWRARDGELELEAPRPLRETPSTPGASFRQEPL